MFRKGMVKSEAVVIEQADDIVKLKELNARWVKAYNRMYKERNKARERIAAYEAKEYHHLNCNYWKWNWAYSFAPSDCNCVEVAAIPEPGTKLEWDDSNNEFAKNTKKLSTYLPGHPDYVPSLRIFSPIYQANFHMEDFCNRLFLKIVD